jgi:hypothetical protein
VRTRVNLALEGGSAKGSYQRNAIERVLDQLQEVRRIREGEYRANCPACGGRSGTKFSITQTQDRVLVHCFGGCPLKSILAALNMPSAAELFDSVQLPDPEARRHAAQQRRAIQGLQRWAERELVVNSRILRDIESLIQVTSSLLLLYESGNVPFTQETINRTWEFLCFAYRWRDELEEYFDILNGRDLAAKLALWRRLESES